MRRLPLLLALIVATSGHATSVRYFAVGHKQRLDDAVSYQTFRDKMTALMDANVPNRGDFVQAGVDDVASHLAGGPTNALVVFPEDVGLAPALIGTRGTAARSQTSAVAAIVSLLGPYGPQIAYYN